MPDYYGGTATATNVFANAIVALSADPGEYKGTFQTTHQRHLGLRHPSPPGLLDVQIGGRTVPILALAHKTG